MSGLFDVDVRELIQLQKWYKRNPRQFRVATGMMLNNFAFGTRREMIEVIEKDFTVRNPRFISSKVRVTRARFADPINAQRSIEGTVYADRFSGLIEQETGQKTDRSRVASIFARGGSEAGQIKPRSRLKPATELADFSTYGLTGRSRTLGALLAINQRKSDNRMIRFKSTVYKRGRGKHKPPRKSLNVVQRINPPNVQPARSPFRRKSVKRYFSKTDIRALWGETINRVMKPPRKR